MTTLSMKFLFEQSLVVMNDGNVFQPLKEANRRWVIELPVEIKIRGLDFRILYELSVGGFIQVEWHECSESMGHIRNVPVGVWFSDDTPTAEHIEPLAVLKLLIAAKQEIPKSLEPRFERLKAELDVPIAEAVPRPFTYWSERVQFSGSTKTLAHTVDVIDTTTHIARLAAQGVQQIRCGGRLPYGCAIPLHFLGGMLFAEYAVVPEHWWGSGREVPPAMVGLLELRWPNGAMAIRDVLRAMQDLLHGPISVTDAHYYGLDDADLPTQREVQLAEEALRAGADELERLAVELRSALDAFEAPQQPQDAEKPIAKRPNDKESIAFQLWLLTGKTQTEIARVLTEDYGITAEQGNVSRWIKAVREYLEASNLLVPLPPPLEKKPTAIDPKATDLGASREGRSLNQRHKKKG